jgi:hypothetical protein
MPEATLNGVAFFLSDIILSMFKADTHRFLAILVLVWFALFIGVAIASPILNPTETQMVCSSAGGMKMVASGEEGVDAKLTANMDCPLCAPVHVPLQACNTSFDHASPLAHSLHPIAAELIAAHTAPPLPSRGPPVV